VAIRLRNDALRYGALAQALHWTMAGLIFSMFGLGWYMEGLPLGPEAFTLYNLHKSLGLLALLLLAGRALWRVISPPPPLPPEMSTPERRAAQISHGLLYALLLVQPASGLVMAFASGFPTIVFGLFSLPSPIAANNGLKDAFVIVHFASSFALAAVIALHVAAALRHHLVLGNDVLRRMLPGSR
jgi:cytochrome b561